MTLNMANWKKGLLLIGLATAMFATQVMGIEQNKANSLNSSTGASRKSFLKGSSKQQQQQQGQGQRSLASGEGGAYKIDFAAADPGLYTIDAAPYPTDALIAKLIVGNYITSGRGNGDDLIPFAKFNDGSSDVKIESLMPEDLFIGQIVPFEIEIAVDGAVGGTMKFTAGWSTETTSKGEFGYDYETYKVLAAFVDTGDGKHNDPDDNARVSSFTSDWVNGDEIQGVFDIEGLEDGDVVVVEVWVVLQNSFPSAGATGNVHSRLIDASTPDDSINTGQQTIPMMKLQDGITDNIEARLGTSSVSDEDLLCL